MLLYLINVTKHTKNVKIQMQVLSVIVNQDTNRKMVLVSIRKSLINTLSVIYVFTHRHCDCTTLKHFWIAVTKPYDVQCCWMVVQSQCPPECTTGFQWGSCYSIFSFICMFYRSLFVLLYFFRLAIVLPVLLRYTDSDYPFGIFKLFLSIGYWYNIAEKYVVHNLSELVIQSTN